MSGDDGWVKQCGQPSGPGRLTEDDTVRIAAHPTTDGTLLSGRVRYRQFRDFHRSGLEPVLMAAAVPARAGERVLEAGCGAGAGLACLGTRIGGLHGAGLELDPDMAALARYNLSCNGLDWPVLTARVEAIHTSGDPFDHVFANPPWHRCGSTPSPDVKRDLARRAPHDVLPLWIDGLAFRLREGGTITLALPASLHAACSHALLGQRFGDIRLMPFWPRQGAAARIVLMQAVLGGRGDASVLSGLVLHHEEGGFTKAANAILRGGDVLRLG